jgi:hypothetical protein
MSKDIFGDEPFRDGAPDFDGGQWKEPETYTPVPESALKNFKMPQPSSAQQVIHQEEIDIEGLTEEVANEDDEEEDFSDVLTDARLRLELGRLYEMVMNHSLFDGVEVDERASKIVQKQIRKFAKEQIELTLGMRQEPTVQNNLTVVSPFNDLEVQVLKKLASAASKGATESEEANQVVESAPAQPPKKKTLNTIGKSSSQTKPLPKAQPKPIVKKAEPIQRAARPQAQPERPPKELTGKMLHEMTEEEKAEHVRGVNERNKAREQVIPKNRAPWPSFEEQVSIAQSQVSRAAGGNSGMSALNGSLSRLVMAGIGKKS